ncbi:MAG: hypothetical protein COT89_01335 [Candidatus Colwellbacteria bacterium CG10_big_fil_rev_8_21_14_0_10_42_22]|uniref:DNA 3'-5' helicase n=1 Tax=Candidatus Colwellbacteria bacterium CG10_big_fil_rev_8_21_14_0_10_42_22 TaxID=1974540 RepID=A0A2H0VG69_9BACT|nr:MAG: hypothetical protein COT89_01335 [Candidatus Colwellbacteria bacterium CG10_big_fil_rev_8_21_14_0_10_42_22]
MPDLSNKEHMDRLKKFSQKISRESSIPKKLVVAGPGAGKTKSFKALLDAQPADSGVLVLTFLGNLKRELERDLGHASSVFTFHGYCHHLLRKYAVLRRGLSNDFFYCPDSLEIIREDWKVLNNGEPPDFISPLRSNLKNELTEFYLDRSDYYDAIGFDDSIFRIYHSLASEPEIDLSYDLILIDEFQDFNKLESDFVELISSLGPIVIAGDDDQGLYEDRLASPKHISDLYLAAEYKNYELPYCTRCTKVIVDSANKFMQECEARNIIKNRIPKKFEYCPPIKEIDSKQYTFIEVVETSVQSGSVNYFGRYIEREIRSILPDDIAKSRSEGFLTALIIASNPFRRAIEDHFRSNPDIELQSSKNDFEPVDRDTAIRKLADYPKSNLWWRFILSYDKPEGWQEIVKGSTSKDALIGLVPDEFRNSVLEEVRGLRSRDRADKTPQPIDETKPLVKIVTFEGSKGLSASHVFIAGMQDGTLPRNPKEPSHIDAKKFYVALTRTRKHCHILFSRNLGGYNNGKPSIFLDWIDDGNKRSLYADKTYFNN